MENSWIELVFKSFWYVFLYSMVNTYQIQQQTTECLFSSVTVKQLQWCLQGAKFLMGHISSKNRMFLWQITTSVDYLFLAFLPVDVSWKALRALSLYLQCWGSLMIISLTELLPREKYLCNLFIKLKGVWCFLLIWPSSVGFPANYGWEEVLATKLVWEIASK